MTTLSNLLPGASYRVRVIALNADGLPSAPSPMVGFSTPDAASYMPLSRGNAHVTFTISTGEDVVLGDTVLWTEEVFLDTKTRTVDMTFSQPASVAGTPMASMALRSIAGFVCRMPHRRTPGGTGGAGGAPLSARLSLSASFASSRHSLASLASGAAAREDSVAVCVVWSCVESKEEWRPRANKTAPILTPAVVAGLVYPAGVVVHRPAAMLCDGGVDLVRCPWYDEASRLSVGVERRRAVELAGVAVSAPLATLR